jgi:ribonuclease HII
MTKLSAGLDEVGYGSWAGPIISVVAVFDEERLARMPAGVTDSKKTTEKQREMLYQPLIQLSLDVGVGHAWPWEIDTLGVSTALQLSYTRAIDELKCQPDLLYVDGINRVRGWLGTQIVEPKADLKYQEVSAASMIAKHFRDTMMADYAKKFPGYGFEKNSGYGTAEHEKGIHELGLLIDMNDKSKYLHRKLYTRKVLIRGS